MALAVSQRASGLVLSTLSPVSSTSYLQSYPAASALAKSCPAPRTSTSSGPSTKDLETGVPAIEWLAVSQGPTNACVAFAFCNAFSVLAPRGTPPLSPYYAYYFQRQQECARDGVCKCPTPGSTCGSPPCLDCGSLLASGVAVFTAGVASLSAWPTSNDINAPPSSAALSDAAHFAVTQTTCVAPGSVSGTKAAIAAGHPVVVFLNLAPNQVAWMSAQALASQTTVLPVMPAAEKGSAAPHGHAVVLTGFTPTGVLARNSFGMAWGGAGGRFVVPWAVFSDRDLCHSAVAVAAVKPITS